MPGRHIPQAAALTTNFRNHRSFACPKAGCRYVAKRPDQLRTHVASGCLKGTAAIRLKRYGAGRKKVGAGYLKKIGIEELREHTRRLNEYW